MLTTNAPWVAVTTQAATEYELVEIYHLTGSENGGKHNVFVELSPPDASLMIGWTWEGKHPDETAAPVALNKSALPGEAGDVPLFKGQRLLVWLQRNDQVVSDTAQNLNGEFDAPQWEIGNSLYHHSYRLRFQRRGASPEPPPVESPTLAELAVRLKRIEDYLKLA